MTAQCGPGPMHQQLAEVAIPTFANPEQARLPARGVFTGHKGQPGRKLTAILEVCRIRHGSQDGSGRERPNPGDDMQPLTLRMCLPIA
jgi:hypothetical protein